MFRLLGFFAGSAAAIVALITLIGTPNFQLNGDSDDDRFRVAVQQLKDKQPMPESSQEAPQPQASPKLAADEEIPDSPPLVPAAEPGPEAIADQSLSSANHSEETDLQASNASTDRAPAENTILPAASDATSDEPVWQSFWNPFRSELAAEGFVRRLENVTGLDYRVERVKNGVYEVAFSYYNDDERDAYLTQIAAATGLDLSGALR